MASIKVLLLVLPSLLASAAAPGPLPNLKDVEHLESQLSHEKCIGNLGAWERRYQLQADPNDRTSADPAPKSIISFRLRQADSSYGIYAGRSLVPSTPTFGDEIDDTPVKMAWGKFDAASGRLSLEFCGLN